MEEKISTIFTEIKNPWIKILGIITLPFSIICKNLKFKFGKEKNPHQNLSASRWRRKSSGDFS